MSPANVNISTMCGVTMGNAVVCIQYRRSTGRGALRGTGVYVPGFREPVVDFDYLCSMLYKVKLKQKKIQWHEE